ncbi:DUF1735 domain-containing protein [bacterium]|nr:DUF1735 domain-containing protein [bacterium]MBU1852670.1 DUF1735 domain-containing protein [Candidatus Omnitrophota bacterium]
MKRILLVFFVSFFFVQSASAGGLSTTFGEVLVEDLRIGEAYSMEKEAKVPLIITNTSNQEVKLKIEVLTPQESELKESFEAIPDIGWVELSQNEFVIGSGQSIKTDVIISIPDDEKYLDKKYQVFIWSYTVGRSIGLGLKSKLLFSTRKAETESR